MAADHPAMCVIFNPIRRGRVVRCVERRGKHLSLGKYFYHSVDHSIKYFFDNDIALSCSTDLRRHKYSELASSTGGRST